MYSQGRTTTIENGTFRDTVFVLFSPEMCILVSPNSYFYFFWKQFTLNFIKHFFTDHCFWFLFHVPREESTSAREGPIQNDP